MSAHVVLGLGFGDEGKGATVDHIASSLDRSLVVRFNGGAQCAHNVVHEGKHHTFSQFGSNSFNNKSETFFSRYAYFNPLVFHRERKALLDLGIERNFYLSDHARITTPWHMALNRIKEIQRGAAIHGSTGMGIGETAADPEPILVKDMMDNFRHVCAADAKVHFRKLFDAVVSSMTPEFQSSRKEAIDKAIILRDIKFEDFVGAWDNLFCSSFKVVDAQTEKQLLGSDNLIFEGAQGVLLDENYGFNPHTTWSTTTDENVFKLIAEAGLDIKPIIVGVLRTRHTRHGAGPFPTYVPDSGLTDLYNKTNEWAGDFRIGHFDSLLLDYALQATRGIDSIAWTHCDWELENTAGYKKQIATAYRMNEVRTDRIHCSKYPDFLASEKLAISLSNIDEVTYEEVDSTTEWVTDKFKIPKFSKAYGPERQDRKFL